MKIAFTSLILNRIARRCKITQMNPTPNALNTSVILRSLIAGECLQLQREVSICSNHPVSQAACSRAARSQAALIILQ